MSTQTTRRGGAAGPGDDEDLKPSFASEVPLMAARAAWQYRWRLAPLYLASCAGIGVGTGHGLVMAGGLTAAAVVGEVSAHTGTKAPDGRMLLSPRERRLAAIGLAGTAAWAGIATFTGLPVLLDLGLLGGVLLWPTHLWWASRRPQPPAPPEPSPFSAMTQEVLQRWAGDISIGDGPRALRGSYPIEESIGEPADGALTMLVQLAPNVHAQSAVTAAARQQVERRATENGLPRNTVRLEEVNEDSGKLRVVITASRHLDVEGGLDWPGPELLENGQVPIAVLGDGSIIAIPLFCADGIRHGMITGTTSVGKSVTSVSVMTPGVKHGVEIILLLDGKRGTSTPYLRPLVGKYARRDEQWPILIEIAYRIMVARQDRRGAAGLYEFTTLSEPDPIITVFIDEPGAVGKSRFFGAKHVRMVLEILEHGRALGVRLIQCGQSPAGEDLIGGVQARGLMSSGWSINHRSGGKGATRLALDSTNANIALNELPPGGAAITAGGKLLGFPAQVRNATKARVLEELEAITVRQLAGADLEAAGADVWNAPHWEDCWSPGYVFAPNFQLTAGVVRAAAIDLSKEQTGSTQQQTGSDQPTGTPDQGDADLQASRQWVQWVLEQLHQHPAGLSLKELELIANGKPSRRTISTSLGDLMGAKQVTKSGAIWSAAPATTRPGSSSATTVQEQEQDQGEEAQFPELSQDDFVDIITLWVTQALQRHGPMGLDALSTAVNVEVSGLSPILIRLIRAELVMESGGRYLITPSTPPNREAYEILTRQQALLAQVTSVIAGGDPDGPVPDPDDTPAGTREDEAGQDDPLSARLWVLANLGDNPEGLTLAQLADIGDGEYGAPSRPALTAALTDLGDRSQVFQNGATWVAVPAEAIDDPDDVDGFAD